MIERVGPARKKATHDGVPALSQLPPGRTGICGERVLTFWIHLLLDRTGSNEFKNADEFRRVAAIWAFHSFEEMMFADQMNNETWSCYELAKLAIQDQKVERSPCCIGAFPRTYLKATPLRHEYLQIPVEKTILNGRQIIERERGNGASVAQYDAISPTVMSLPVPLVHRRQDLRQGVSNLLVRDPQPAQSKLVLKHHCFQGFGRA